MNHRRITHAHGLFDGPEPPLDCRCPPAAPRPRTTPPRARPPRPYARPKEEPSMVKHYLKYAVSTLTAAMFLHMA